MSKKRLTLAQFVKHPKYKQLNITAGCLANVIKRGQLSAFKHPEQPLKIAPDDVFRWLVKLNKGNPKAIQKLNQIFYGTDFYAEQEQEMIAKLTERYENLLVCTPEMVNRIMSDKIRRKSRKP
ncbi:MAG: hypothetical protein A2Y10_19675 [Planctomycetes bacterium GWF2_41_51]|nr:MAG: hypothetical protein A2Y10_19675 [Planctomycetes bacterium GWF2_41_51]HBG28200.1 hypothetical protein [Phycisphaerales bacterium]